MKVKVEMVADVLSSIGKDDFVASLDLKDAYLQIPVYQKSNPESLLHPGRSTRIPLWTTSLVNNNSELQQ